MTTSPAAQLAALHLGMLPSAIFALVRQALDDATITERDEYAPRHFPPPNSVPVAAEGQALELTIDLEEWENCLLALSRADAVRSHILVHLLRVTDRIVGLGHRVENGPPINMRHSIEAINSDLTLLADLSKIVLSADSELHKWRQLGEAFENYFSAVRSLSVDMVDKLRLVIESARDCYELSSYAWLETQLNTLQTALRRRRENKSKYSDLIPRQLTIGTGIKIGPAYVVQCIYWDLQRSLRSEAKVPFLLEIQRNEGYFVHKGRTVLFSKYPERPLNAILNLLAAHGYELDRSDLFPGVSEGTELTYVSELHLAMRDAGMEELLVTKRKTRDRDARIKLNLKPDQVLDHAD